MDCENQLNSQLLNWILKITMKVKLHYKLLFIFSQQIFSH